MHKQNRLKFYGFATILSLVLMFLAQGSILAQDITVKGKIVDAATNEPVPGVNISVKGTGSGTISDLSGEYTISVPSTGTLVVTYIGYTTQEIAVNGQSTIDIALQEDVSKISEVVVVGYGTRLKEELTGAVATMSDKQMELTQESSVVNRMQGKIAGVTITTSNRPGADANISIRGVGTVNDANPLYVIDGVPVGPGNNLNPNDIESISVLKDASSAAIYGTRGANGVILITTKHGRKDQKTSINVTVRTGVKSGMNQYDLLNTKEYGEALWLTAKNLGTTNYSHPQYGSGASPVIPDYILPAGAMEGNAAANPALYKYPDYVIFKANKSGTNWYDEIYQNAKVQEYDLAISGGSSKASYSMSANYLNEQGMLKYTDFERFNFRLNATADFSSWLKAGQSMQVVYIDEKGDLGDHGEGVAISMAYRMQPIVPVYDISGVNFAGTKAPGMGNAGNPVAQLYRARNNKGQYMRAIGSLFAEATIIKGLTFKTLFGYNVGQWNYKGYTIPTYEASEPNRVNGMNTNSNFGILWNWSNTLNYSHAFGNNQKLNVIVGTEAVSNTYREMGASRSQYFSESPDYMQVNSGEMNKDNNGTSSAWSLFSQFGRVNYDIMGKYLLEATVRRDGSSRFGSENRYGIFPAASAAWVLSQENFMPKAAWLDLLKVRLGWGVSGNDRIGEYNMYSTFRSSNYTAAYDLNGSNTSAIAGFEPATVGNNDVSWETTKTLNLGLDGGFLNNTLTLSFDYWTRNTTDMLYRLSVPEVMGLATPPFVNIGEMKNNGFDLELGYHNALADGKFTYSAALNISHYKNELVKLSDKAAEVMGYSERQVEYTRATTGRAFPEFYGYIVEGIYQTDAEAAAGPDYGGGYNKAGHFKYKDLNGDGKISASDDRTYIGSPHPKFTGGLNIDLGYSNFSLNMFFYGSYGNDMINYVSRWIDYGMFNGGLSKDALYNSWTPTNTGARLPMLDQASGSQQASTAFIEDGSFLRLKNLRLGYTFPKNIMDKMKMQNLRVYLQMTNLLTFTKYSGLDPDVRPREGNAMRLGVDQGAWPSAREIMFGVSFGF